MINKLLLVAVMVALTVACNSPSGSSNSENEENTYTEASEQNHIIGDTHDHQAGEAHDHTDAEEHDHQAGEAHDHSSAEAPDHTNAEAHDHADGETHDSADAEAHNHEQETSGQHNSSIPHTLYTVKRMPFSAVIRTSGIIMVDSRDEVAITAGTSGIVEFTDHFLFPGVKVERGTPLFNLSGKNITGNSRDVEYARAEANYIKAEADMQRADSLIGLKLITAEHYNSIKNEFSVATALFNSYRSNSGSSFTRVVSPHEGFIKEITVREGELVEAGRILAVLTIKHNMILKADMPHTMMQMAEEITGARFSPGYSKRVFSVDEMGGSILSYGRSTGDNSFYIPVYFRFNFTDDLIPGSFADVWLLGRTIEDALVVPNIAILEDYGKKYLLIESSEGVFEKRYFTPGATDGIYTIAENGLSGGEIIVSEGAYQIKMSLNSSAPAAHTH
jgi:RND family efflux transporter MFP subunit